MASLVRKAALLLFTEGCMEEYFVKFNFLHGECFKASLSKGLGLGIIAGSLLVKLPQILKLLNNKSGEGINIISVFLDLFAITATVSYSFISKFPFSSWGDGVFLGVQTAAIAALVLHYGGNTTKATAFIAAYISIITAVIIGLVPVDVLWTCQALNVPILLTSKLMQAYTNYSNGSTGQLSAATCFMLFFGSLARIFTSIQETGDTIIIVTYIVATSANALIASQLIYYWNVVPKAAKDSKKKKQ